MCFAQLSFVVVRIGNVYKNNKTKDFVLGFVISANDFVYNISSPSYLITKIVYFDHYIYLL